MTIKYTAFICAAIALLLCSVAAVEAEDADVEHTTASPIADMALVDTVKVSAGMEHSENKTQRTKADSAQPHTIADFIIHPLIALKPRLPEEPAGEGKQAVSSTTPSPWQLFGFNAGQGLGSSVSSLAGTVTGWLGNRIQLPGLVDTPVRESISTSTSTTTTTTARPDVVVRVKQRSSTLRPLIRIGNGPNRFNSNNINDSEEYLDDDEYDDAYDNSNRGQDDGFANNVRYHEDDEEDDDFEEDELPRDDEEEDGENVEEEEEEEDEEEERPIRKNKPNQRKRRPSKAGSSRRGNNSNPKRRLPNGQSNRNQKRKRPQGSQEEEDGSEFEDVDETEEEDDDNDSEDETDQDFYYNDNGGSIKRSQNQQTFIQRGQQSLIKQIRHLTRGQGPVGVASTTRKGANTSNGKKRRQQATLIINRNGQTIYLGPEVLESSDTASQTPYYTPSNAIDNKRYPQPPLTVPFKRKGKPTQYITIPWTQLGISQPNRLVSVTEGIQSQPLILNIPQSALDAMQAPKPVKMKPVPLSEAVPLLAEASLMDVFKPPQIPHNRTPTTAKITKKTTASVTPVLIATNTKQRVRPGTIVEMAPAVDTPIELSESSTETLPSSDNEAESGQYILVGEDAEGGLGRHAFPILGEPRQYTPFTPYFNIFHARQYTGRNGRQLSDPKEKLLIPATTGIEHQREIRREPQMQVTVESAKETTDVQNIDVIEEPMKAASVDEIKEPMMAIAVEETAAVKETHKAAPVEKILKSVDVELSAIQNSEQVIPVHVITSDSQTVNILEGVPYLNEYKSQ